MTGGSRRWIIDAGVARLTDVHRNRNGGDHFVLIVGFCVGAQGIGIRRIKALDNGALDVQGDQVRFTEFDANARAARQSLSPHDGEHQWQGVGTNQVVLEHGGLEGTR